MTHDNVTDIVERLRSKHCCDTSDCNCDEAADTIAKQQADLATLRANITTKADWIEETINDMAVQDETIATLRKQLENAREALEKLIAAVEFEAPPIIDGVQVDAVASLRALPTVSDGWEDIETCPEGVAVLVWCECDRSGMKWITIADKENNGEWFSEADGYVPAKMWRPLPAPPTIGE